MSLVFGFLGVFGLHRCSGVGGFGLISSGKRWLLCWNRGSKECNDGLFNGFHVFASSSSTAGGGAGEGDFSSTATVGSFTSSVAISVSFLSPLD
ncbi:uncharacterized protein G2W53_016068 [Senna tora]|uniref:Secreted protein n=1 Tax=Senna tora TaxID=362788 RepID=A0A834WVY6_9FABA|nr:uncharacterized protein G2W53_016068 [Senna tora]